MSGARRWILGLVVVAVIFISVIVGLLVTRPEHYGAIQNFAAIGRGAKAPMGLTVDKAGNVYGSTATGGPGSWGTIFELISPALFGSRWQMRVLSNVDGRTIGTGPIWSMIGQDGDLYGMTNDGETFCRLKRGDDGWGEPVPLYRFTVRLSPFGTTHPELIPDKFGSFYGTTAGRGGTMLARFSSLVPVRTDGSRRFFIVLLAAMTTEAIRTAALR